MHRSECSAAPGAAAAPARLARRGLTAVLVGRDANRLHTTAQQTGSETLLAPSLAAAAAEIRRQRPAVVIDTVGPFTTTAPGHTLVTGAGFGVTATESVVVKLCGPSCAASGPGRHGALDRDGGRHRR